MGIKKYFDIVAKNFLTIILIAFLTTTVTAYVVFCRFIPIYESSTSIYVIKNDAGEQYTDIAVINQLVRDYQKLITSRMLIDTVAQSMDLNGNEVSKLIKNLSVNQEGDSNIIRLTVRDKDPKIAQSIAQKFTDIFIEKIFEITTVKNVSVKAVDKPNLPQEPVSPNKTLDIAIAFLLSITGSLGVLFLRESFDTTLRTSEDIERYLKLKVLGTIPLRNIR